jgi:hypothetical protein
LLAPGWWFGHRLAVRGTSGLEVSVAADVYQVVVHLVGIAADDLKRPEGTEPGMANLDITWCDRRGRGPCLCRRPQHNQPDSRRELLVVPGLGEGVLVPAGDAPVRVVGEGEQPLGPDPQDIHQVPHIH